ncbi:transposase [bacterium]|nr:transposase [bacterium]
MDSKRTGAVACIISKGRVCRSCGSSRIHATSGSVLASWSDPKTPGAPCCRRRPASPFCTHRARRAASHSAANDGLRPASSWAPSQGSANEAESAIGRCTALRSPERRTAELCLELRIRGRALENFNGNLQKELFDPHRFYDVAEMKRRLATHLHWFNHRRTHHALGGLLVPADRYYGRVQEVLARIEAGAGAEIGDALELRDRDLDLFRVTSRGGKTEVWLMGQRLLGSP